MGFLKLKKKILRVIQTATGTTVDTTPELNGYPTRTILMNHYRKVKPAERLAYYTAFRMFTREIKFEYSYEEAEQTRPQLALVRGDDSANN